MRFGANLKLHQSHRFSISMEISMIHGSWKSGLILLTYTFPTVFIGVYQEKISFVIPFSRSVEEKKKMSTPKEIVTNAIEGNKVVIFSKKSCPFCKMAKGVFDKLNKTYTAIEIDEMQECDEIQNVLEELTGARTVPRVFVQGEFIGGGSDVKKMFESGELQKKFD